MKLPSTLQALRKIFCLPLLVAFVIGNIPVAYGAKAPSEPQAAANGAYEEIQVLKGDIQTVAAKNLKRVSITDPSIADINEAKADAVDVIGIEPGQTILFVWDDAGKRTVIVRVVQEDMSILKKRLQSLLDSAEFKNVVLKENAYEGKVVLTGTVPEDKFEVLAVIIDPFSEQIINLVQREELEDLVQIDMQITELSTTLTKALGVDWASGDQTLSGAQATTTTTTASGLTWSAGEIIPTQTGSLGDIFKIGKFYRSQNTALVARLNLLIEEGKAKVLSKPRLVVISGKEATFLVGGEIPIKTTTTSASGGSSQESVTFKEYGISLAVTPNVQDGNMVNVLLSVEVSDIDGSKPSGNDVAFLTRSAHTQLLLEDRQTIVLAGMIKRRKSESVKRIPLISKIPVVGMLFRNSKTPSANEDMETVISITTTILRSGKAVAEAKERSSDKRSTEKASATATAAKPVADTVSDGGFSAYADDVQKKIASAIAYPYEAQEKGWQGTVKLSITLQKDGMLRSVVVKDSSGYPVFDQDAINTAQILAPYAPFPTGTDANEITFNIPIVYNLETFLKNVSASK